MDLMKMLMSSLGDNGIAAIGKQAGVSPGQAKNALAGAMPVLLGAMAKNASSSQGATGLLGALDRDHDGSILDDLAGFIGNSNAGSSNSTGAGILKHVLGGKRSTVETALGSKVGIDSSSMSKIMEIAAPILMGMLSKQKQQAPSSGFSADGIGGLLKGLAGGADKSTGLDLGDLMGMVGSVTGNGKSSGGGLLGGMLKGLFKR